MARVSLGVMGANLAAVIRGVVGIVWYGVQTYFASKAVATIILLFVLRPRPRRLRTAASRASTRSAGSASCSCGSARLMIFQRGMETIRKFIDFCGPAVYVVDVRADGLDPLPRRLQLR